MTKQLTKTKKGFTIIEVVLVLAVAGLIFLMVFVALPAMQRSQRDTDRRNKYALLATALTNYQTNHNGNLPTAGVWDWDTNGYLDAADFTDPSTGAEYQVTVADATANAAALPALGAITVYTNASCSNDDTVQVQANQGRKYAIYAPLESGGAYCQDNS